MTKSIDGYIGITLPVESTKSADGATELYSHPQLKDIYDIDNLYNGYLSARKGKRNKKAIYEFENNLWQNLEHISQALKDKTYKPSKYREFTIYEPKKRVVIAPSFADSVVQHTIYTLIYPIFDRGFIDDSYGCRKGKGTHKASDRLQRSFRKSSGGDYYLQMDIEGYYYNVNHDILKDRISRKIKDNELVDVIMLFVDFIKGVGLNIGNLLSQLFGLVYLDWFDHFAKRVLKVKHYVRYVDDFVMSGLSYTRAKQLLAKSIEFFGDKLKLKLSKFRIAKIKRGCNFVGYRTWRSKKYIRKRSLHHFSKALKCLKYDVLVSLLGHAKHTSTIGYFHFKIKEHLGCTTNTKYTKQRVLLARLYDTNQRMLSS